MKTRTDEYLNKSKTKLKPRTSHNNSWSFDPPLDQRNKRMERRPSVFCVKFGYKKKGKKKKPT